MTVDMSLTVVECRLWPSVSVRHQPGRASRDSLLSSPESVLAPAPSLSTVLPHTTRACVGWAGQGGEICSGWVTSQHYALILSLRYRLTPRRPLGHQRQSVERDNLWYHSLQPSVLTGNKLSHYRSQDVTITGITTSRAQAPGTCCLPSPPSLTLVSCGPPQL